MADEKRQIIAIGGGGFYRDSENLGLGKVYYSTDGYCGGKGGVCTYRQRRAG